MGGCRGAARTLAAPYTHVVAVDPPPYPQLAELAMALPGEGWTHLAWGAPEQELARRVLAWELDLRAPLGEVYRSLRAAAAGPASRGRTRGAGLDPARLRRTTTLGRGGRAPAARPRGAGAGRAGSDRGRRPRCRPLRGRTQLERSPAFRFSGRRLAAGLAYLADPVVAAEPVAAAPQTAIAV